MVLGMFDLQSHGGDTYVGEGPEYPWGGLYGGQIVAQALRAAAETVPGELTPHSLRAYFIRRGDHHEPVRYEVDRIRDGRSFAPNRWEPAGRSGPVRSHRLRVSPTDGSQQDGPVRYVPIGCGGTPATSRDSPQSPASRAQQP